jgi:hypothetical protein
MLFYALFAAMEFGKPSYCNALGRGSSTVFVLSNLQKASLEIVGRIAAEIQKSVSFLGENMGFWTGHLR